MSQAAAVKSDDTIKPTTPAVRNVAVPLAPQAPEDAILYKVRDLLAYNGPRVHELPDSRGIVRKYAFANSESFVEIPMPIAAKLIGNDGFQVLNERGHEMRVQKLEGEGNNKGVILAYDEVVAKYDELTLDALKARVERAGGKIQQGARKDDLVSFLIEASLTDAGKQVADGEFEGIEEEVDNYA